MGPTTSTDGPEIDRFRPGYGESAGALRGKTEAAGLLRRWPVRVAIGVYLAAGGALVWFGRDHINPDGVAYVQIARHYANARWDLAVSSYWSPLLSWLLVPFAGGSVEPMLAAKVLGLPLGIVFAFGTVAVTRELLQADPDTRPRPSLMSSGSAVAFTSALLATLPMLPRPVTPDLLLAAILTWYFAFTLRWLREASVRHVLFAGLLGGLAALAKAYALPFVLVHAVVTWMTASPRFGAGRALGLGLGSLLLTLFIAAPWMAVISIREGRPTFTSVTRFTLPWHADPASEVGARELFGLTVPGPGRLTTWERPEDIAIAAPDPPVSPKGGVANFASRLDVHVVSALSAFKQADPLGLLAAGLAVACLLLAAVRPGEAAPARWPLGWCLATIALYAGGYVLAYVEARYLWPVFGLTMALAVTVLGRVHRATVGWPSARFNTVAGLLLVGSLAYGGVRQLTEWGSADGPGAGASALRGLASSIGQGPPLASNRWPQGLYVAYWSSTPFLGRADTGDPATTARELAAVAPVRLLIFDDRESARQLARRAGIVLQRSVDGAWGTADVLYVEP